MTTFKRNGGKATVRDSAQCAVCKEPVDIEFPVRSNTWAFGILGVRMMLCSKPCQEAYDQQQEVA